MWARELASGSLRAPVAEVAMVRLGARDVRAHWRRRGGRRAVAHLTMTDAHDDPLDLDLVFAPWNGGTVVELGAAGARFGGQRLRRRRLHRALDRSLRDLAVTVARPLERPPVVPRPRGLARTDVAPA